MPSPELIDERFDEIVRELRTLPGAPETLRKRVLELAEEESQERRSGWWSRISLRTGGWTLATAVAGVMAVALAYGVLTSGAPEGESVAVQTLSGESSRDSGDRVLAPSPKTAPIAPPPPPPPFEAARPRSASPPLAIGSTGAEVDSAGAVTLPPGQRLAQYTASMRLRVSDLDELSRTTREAMRISRRLGGFVASVDYAQPKGEEGDATLRLRVPAAKIQQAIAQLSELGVIVSQQIKITDVQNRVNDDTAEIARLRRSIRRIEARLKQPISEDERYRLELQLENARASVKALTGRRDATVRRARLATIGLTLTTREADEQPAAPPGRIERAARKAASLLAKEAAAVVYGAIVLSPLLLLGAAALVATRAHRRRFDQRLLEQA